MTHSPHFPGRLAAVVNYATQSVTCLPRRDVGSSTPDAARAGQATLVLTDRGLAMSNKASMTGATGPTGLATPHQHRACQAHQRWNTYAETTACINEPSCRIRKVLSFLLSNRGDGSNRL
jgi:hypothetical protein